MFIIDILWVPLKNNTQIWNHQYQWVTWKYSLYEMKMRNIRENSSEYSKLKISTFFAQKIKPNLVVEIDDIHSTNTHSTIETSNYGKRFSFPGLLL